LSLIRHGTIVAVKKTKKKTNKKRERGGENIYSFESQQHEGEEDEQEESPAISEKEWR